MNRFTQKFLDTYIYRYLSLSDHKETSSLNKDKESYKQEENISLEEQKTIAKFKILEMFNHETSLNKILNSKANGVPLLFLIRYFYNNILEIFKTNEYSEFKEAYIEKVEKAKNTLRDDFGNRLDFYDPETKVIIKTCNGKFNKEGIVLREKDYPLDGFVLRSYKSRLALLNCIEKREPPTEYNQTYISENSRRINNFPTFYDNELFEGDYFQYIFGKSKEDQIFSWDLIDIFPKDLTISNYDEIINFFDDNVPNKDDEDDISFMVFNTTMNEKQRLLRNDIPAEFLPKLLPYVIKNLHRYLIIDDEELRRNQAGSRQLTLGFITSCHNKKLLDQFSNCLNKVIKHHYYWISDVENKKDQYNDLLIEILKTTEIQYNKIKIDEIQKIETKQSSIKKRKVSF
jgi:hypothetical protein